MNKTRASQSGFSKKKKKKKKKKKEEDMAYVSLRKIATLCKIEIMDSNDHL